MAEFLVRGKADFGVVAVASSPVVFQSHRIFYRYRMPVSSPRPRLEPLRLSAPGSCETRRCWHHRLERLKICVCLAYSTDGENGFGSQPKVWYFAIANAQSLMLEGAALETVLQDGIERAQRARRDQDVWLIMEPAFLSEHPGLAALNKRLKKPTAAILSLNAEWMLTYVKQKLPQAVIGKFVAPSTAVSNPFQSNLNPGSEVIGGGGVWH